jgi:hypothetical protein
MADWNWDAAFVVALHLYPERHSPLRLAVCRFNVGQALPDAVSCIVMHSMTYMLYRELPFPIKLTDRWPRG